MTRLKVSSEFTGQKLVVIGPVTGTRYEYRRATGNGKLAVDDRDVPDLLTKMLSVSDCGCSDPAKGGKSRNGNVTQVRLFTKE